MATLNSNAGPPPFGGCAARGRVPLRQTQGDLSGQRGDGAGAKKHHTTLWP